ncbi:hypothetical protein Q0590_06255 [Rhodocytophaga aerolata]|uniref:Uncharacterized protein n=1 Tax=Rhodocytophaga aerolata TaxID=455078 RepID=A0ABT8R180_9BACT|nr:hypothetical protein [Rhodocytophaga aerolata]MDO1445844.1 hypothetical protein [Rhodocytophaga aerolata]
MMQWSQLGVAETLSIAALAGAIWATYVFVVFRRHSLPEAGIRSALLAMALCCLCLIIYQPQYSVSKPGGKALLLTQSMPKIPDSLPVFALPDVKTTANVQEVPDLGFIERNHPEIQEIYVAGYTLEPAQAKNLQRLKVHFLEEEAPEGFNWLSYSRRIKQGEEFLVSGTYRHTTADTVKLGLSTIEGLQDSVRLVSGESRFSLQAQTQLAGNYMAALHIRTNDSVRTEFLPYTVEEKRPLHVLLLQGFPSFELNYLKDWIGQAKHHIQMRARISRDKYATQTININQDSGPKPPLSAENLADMDLLICDAESLRQLSAAENKRIQQAVANGLGLLVLADEAWLKNPQINSQTFPISPSTLLSFAPRQEPQAAQGKAMADKLPATFAANSLLIPVAYSREGEIIAAYRPDGKGRVGAMLVTATFPWLLQGETAVYNRLWTDILESFSRRQYGREIHLAEFPFIVKDFPAHFHSTDTVRAPAIIQYASGLQQHAMPKGGLPLTGKTSYQFIPVEEGWLQINYGEDTTSVHQVYVLPAHAWADLRQATWWRQNQQNLSVEAPDKTYAYPAWEDIPLLWFFLPLVASLSLLWWREKA